ncbi:MAG: 30S ribosomal protein S18 [Desulfovibrionaceae bacterium]
MQKRKFAPRRKFCRFCADKNLRPSYKVPKLLMDFVTERGKIIPRRITGTCGQHQNLLTSEIKRARQMTLMFYTPLHSTEVQRKSQL